MRARPIPITDTYDMEVVPVSAVPGSKRQAPRKHIEIAEAMQKLGKGQALRVRWPSTDPQRRAAWAGAIRRALGDTWGLRVSMRNDAEYLYILLVGTCQRKYP